MQVLSSSVSNISLIMCIDRGGGGWHSILTVHTKVACLKEFHVGVEIVLKTSFSSLEDFFA